MPKTIDTTIAALKYIHAVARKILAKRGKGIASIASKGEAESKAGEIAAIFQQSGLPMNRLDEFIKSEKDVTKYLNLIEEATKKPLVKFDNDDLSTMSPDSVEGRRISDLLLRKKKSGDVIDFPPERITDWTKERPGRADLPEIPKKTDPALYEDRGGNIIPAQFKDVVKETDEQIIARIKKQNKEAAERLRNKKDPDEPEGFYQGGQAQIKPDLSNIGHGSDALMARNMLIAPGSQATTSTGLSYLLGEDNDTTRVPYNEGNTVLPQPKPSKDYQVLQILNKQPEAALKTLGAETMFNLIHEHAPKAFENGDISKEEYDRMMEPFSNGGTEKLQSIKNSEDLYLSKYAEGGVAGLLGERTGYAQGMDVVRNQKKEIPEEIKKKIFEMMMGSHNLGKVIENSERTKSRIGPEGVKAYGLADGGRTGYKEGEDVFIGPKRKKKTKKELEEEKKLRAQLEAYLESQTINLPEENPLKKYQPTDYSLYGGFMDNIKTEGDRTGNVINDFNNINIDPRDARVGFSRDNPKNDSSFVAGVGPSGFNIGFTKPFAEGGLAGLLGEGPRSTDHGPRTNYKEAGVVDKIGGMVNYKNVPHYLAKPLKGVTNIAEWAGRLPFATAKLASDIIRKPLFKPGDRVEGLPGLGAKFVGKEMFNEFINNMTPGALAENLGLTALADKTGKNLTDEARSVGDLLESLGEFANMGGILSAGKNLFKGPDLLKKLSQSIGKVKDNKTLEKLVDETLTARGEGRRDFNKLVASGGLMVALQSIGLGGIKAAKTKSAPDAVFTLKTIIDDSDVMTENGLMAIGRGDYPMIDVSGLTDAVKKSLAVIMKNSKSIKNKVKVKGGKFTDDYEDIPTEEAAYIMEELQKKGHNVKLEHYDDMGGQGVDDLLNKYKNKDKTYGKDNYDKFSKRVAKMTDKEKFAYHSSITDDSGNYYDEFVEELLDMNFKNSTK